MHNNSLSGITSIIASGDIARGTIATITGSISPTSGSLQTLQGTSSGNNGVSKSRTHWNENSNNTRLSNDIHGVNCKTLQEEL